MSKPERRLVAKRASRVAFIVLLTTTLMGSLIFQAFGITLPAFRIAGGIILFLIALEMLRANPTRYRTSKEEQKEAEERDDVAIFPVGIPLLAGPGSITTALILGEQAFTWDEHLVLILVLAAGMAGVYFTLRSADRISDKIGAIGKNVLTRLMGIVLAAVAAQFVIDGLVSVFQSPTAAVDAVRALSGGS